MRGRIIESSMVLLWIIDTSSSEKNGSTLYGPKHWYVFLVCFLVGCLIRLIR